MNCFAHDTARSRPVVVPPVKEIVGTSGCCTRAAPASAPYPWTMFKTPGGNPASPDNSAKRVAVAGVTSLGLATTVHPAARAGATFHDSKYNGRFHGEMHPATPRGRRWVQCNTCGPLVKASLCSCRKAEAKNRKFSATRGISTDRARAIGLPPSCDSSTANSSQWSSISAAKRSRIDTRSAVVVWDHVEKAERAACTARSMSVAVPAAQRANFLPVAGSVTGIQPPSEAGTKLPSIQWCRSIIRPPPGRRRQEWSCR